MAKETFKTIVALIAVFGFLALSVLFFPTLAYKLSLFFGEFMGSVFAYLITGFVILAIVYLIMKSGKW